MKPWVWAILTIAKEDSKQQQEIVTSPTHPTHPTQFRPLTIINELITPATKVIYIYI